MKSPQGTHVVAWLRHGLGDVIMALPGLVLLDRTLPAGSTITAIVKSPGIVNLLELLRWQAAIKVICLESRGAAYYAKLFGILRSLRLNRPDIYMAPHASSSLSASLFARLVHARVSVGPEGAWSSLGYRYAIRWEAGMHKTDYYARFSQVAVKQRSEPIAITLITKGEKERELDRRLASINSKGPLVVMAPGASPVETHKLWGHDKYSALAHKLLETYPDARIALFGGGSEFARLKLIANGLDKRVIVFAEDDLELSFALLRRTSCLVCACSGAAHMAAIVGTPTVALYGPTNPSTTGPRHARVRIVRKNYQCSPCYRPGFEAGCGNPVCIRDISVDEVLTALAATLNGEPFPLQPQFHTTTARDSDKTVRLVPARRAGADATAT